MSRSDENTRSQASPEFPSKVLVQVKALESWIASTFEHSPVGVVRIDLDFRILYANKKALEIFGIDSYASRGVFEFLHREAINILSEKIFSRQKGQSEEYEVNVIRASDKRDIPVKVIAMPVFGQDGTVIGAVSLIHNMEIERAAQAIEKCVQQARSASELLMLVARATKQIVPSDACTVSVYSRDQLHSRVLFSDAPELIDLYSRRWFSLSPSLREWAQHKETVIVPDMIKFTQEMQGDPDFIERTVPLLTSAGWHSFMRYPVVRGDKVIGSFALSSKVDRAFSDEDRKRLVALPLDTALASALHYEAVRDLEFRLNLLRDILHCSTNTEIFRLVADQLVAHYGWKSVSIFSVNERAQSAVLLVQSAQLETLLLPDKYEQPLDKGVLGYAYKHRKTVNIDNVARNSEFRNVFVRMHEFTASELCIPIMLNGTVYALLNIEDDRENGFAPEELDVLHLVLAEVETVIARFRNERLISSTYQATPSAVWVVDNKGKITKANPAAQALFGLSEQELIGTSVQEYFQDKALGLALVFASDPISKEVTLLGQDKRPVSVLLGGGQLGEEFPGEKVITARDLSGHRRVEQIRLLDQLYYEIATQVKTPLILANTWLKKLADPTASEGTRETAEKISRQLQKAEITYDRLALFDNNGEVTPYHSVRFKLLDLLKDILDEFPRSESELVTIECGNEDLPFISGDMYQLSFVFKTILSYLIRFSTEETRIVVRLALVGPSISVSVSGPLGTVLGSGELRRQSDRALLCTLSEMALGQRVIDKFVLNHRGVIKTQQIDGNQMTFRVDLPLPEAQARP
jgi:PAS domain S-box-containing protein